MNSIYTVGHSNLHIDHFIGIIKKNNINMIIDIRSVPFSGFILSLIKKGWPNL